MAKEFHGYFDPTAEDDRQYSADEFAMSFRAMGGTGAGSGLTITPAGGTAIKVSPGYAMIYGYTYALLEDGGEPKGFTLAGSGNADRLDRLVLRLDLSATGRAITMEVKAGVPAPNPEPPALENTALVKEISLGQVRVAASASAISGEDITDEREDAEVCGLLVLPPYQFAELDKRYNFVEVHHGLGSDSEEKALSAAMGKKLEQEKFAIANVYNDLDETEPGKALDARQGKALHNALIALAGDELDVGVHVYVHTYDPITGTHNFSDEGAGYANGRALTVAPFTAGDSFTVNGLPVTAYSGEWETDEMPAGRWVTFVYHSAGETINFKQGGGLSIKVIFVNSAAALPPAAKEGTIAVTAAKTDRVTFRTQAPPSPMEGDVWIQYGTESGLIVPVSKKPEFMLALLRANVYQSGAWAVKECHVMISGAWKSSRLYLYYLGQNFKPLNTAQVGSYGFLAYEAQNLRLYTTAYCSVLRVGYEGINFEPYSYVHFDVTLPGAAVAFRIVIGPTYDSALLTTASTTSARKIMTLDVRNITVTSGLWFGMNERNARGEYVIHGIWME